MDVLNLLLGVEFWTATVRIASPLIFGALGELLCERSGVLNLGIEGIMTIGAFVGWASVYQGADLWTGVLLAATVGLLFGLLHSLFTVYLGLSQHVTGIGITLLAANLAYFFYRVLLPDATTPPKITPFQPYPIPLLSQIPIVGQALFTQTPLTYLAIALVGVIAYVLYATPLGLSVRMVGENPQAAEAQGLSVYGVRTGAVMAGSALMAIGGAFLTLSAFDSFFVNLINGRGWICIALVIFASWQPFKALLGALLFAGFDALQIRLQQQIGGAIPYQVFLALPYILSIVALTVMARRAGYPKALMVPFRRGER
ncbi:ABC transporter permease [Leptolyngbya ohadii]|uniref:ABC transporter permease n=1 Tax=Leptolyngbya ohadii TaxID=1962290 RepID=UPI000B598913|nr:ABC transporter permease [Leptolyngbya ohadii]